MRYTVHMLTTHRTALAFWLLSIAGITGACDDSCARLVYVDLHGPTASERTVIVNALACDEDQHDLWLRVGPSEDPAESTFVALPTVPAGTCFQAGHPDVQWGVEFVKAEFGGADPWPEYAAALGQDLDYIDAMSTVDMQRRDVAAPLRADSEHGWHEVAWYGGDCSLLPAP